MLDVKRLRLLSELSRRETIAAVARVVGYTPSAVSQSLAQLERETGVALLERDGRRVRLTPAARALAARADRILAELDAAEAELAAGHATVSGAVVIGAFPSAATELVLPAVAALDHPQLTCVVREHEPEDGVGLLRAGELDLLISESYEDLAPAPATGGLETHPLLEEPLLVAGRRGTVALAGLAELDWVGGLAGTQFAAAVELACRRAGFAPRIVHRADEASLLIALAEGGYGVALVPRLACAGAQAAEALPPPPRRRIFALSRRGTAARPAVAAVLQALTRRASSAAISSSGRFPSTSTSTSR